MYEYGDMRDSEHGQHELKEKDGIDPDHTDVVGTVLRVNDTYFGVQRGLSEPILQVVDGENYPDPLKKGSLRGEDFFSLLTAMDIETIDVLDIEESPLTDKMSVWEFYR